MLGLVVIALIAAQRLQNRDGDGGEEAVGADYDGEDREEIHRHGHAGIVHEHRHGVARTQEENPYYREKPVGFRFFFTHIAAAQQLNRARTSHLGEIRQQRQQYEPREKEHHDDNGYGLYREAEGYGQAHEPEERQAHELGEQDAHGEAAADADEGDVERLKHHDAGDVRLAHAEHAV